MRPERITTRAWALAVLAAGATLGAGALSACGRAGGGSAVAAPQTARALLTSAQTAVDEKAFGRAESILTGAIEVYPDDAALRVALGDLMAARERYTEAGAQYARALEIGPRGADLAFKAGMMARLGGAGSIAAGGAGGEGGALSLLNEAATADPTNPEYAYQCGLAMADAGMVDTARAMLERAASLDDTRAEVHGALAELELDAGRPAEAIGPANRAAALEPDELAYRLQRIRAIAGAGEPGLAAELLGAITPPERFAPGTLGAVDAVLGGMGRLEEVAAWYARASEAFPAEGDLAVAAAERAAAAGDTEAARRLARRGVDFGGAGAEALLERLGG